MVICYLFTANSPQGSISSLQLSKQLGITQKTAWFMLHRLRETYKPGSFKMSGVVSSDESYFGGDSKNKPFHKRPKIKRKTDKVGSRLKM